MHEHRNRKGRVFPLLLWSWVPSHHAKTLFWQALNYLHSSLPKLLKYVRSWSNRKAFGARGRQSFPLWAVGDQTWKQEKNKGLSGLLKTPGPQQPIKIHSEKQAWNTRWLHEPLKRVRILPLYLRYPTPECVETFIWDIETFTLAL